MIYKTEFISSSPKWTPVTNGLPGQSNFLISTEDFTSQFYEAQTNTNTVPFVLHLTVQAPINGSNVQ